MSKSEAIWFIIAISVAYLIGALVQFDAKAEPPCLNIEEQAEEPQEITGVL